MIMNKYKDKYYEFEYPQYKYKNKTNLHTEYYRYFLYKNT